MTPVRQTIIAPNDGHQMPGNCLQAAIASLLDLPLDEVPHFVGDDWASGGDKHWWTEWYQWLYARDLKLHTNIEPEPGEYYLGNGPSPRDPENRQHVAVYRDGALAHDPHPDGTGVVEVLTRWVIRPVVAGRSIRHVINELGNDITVTVEVDGPAVHLVMTGPTSTATNTVTRLEASALMACMADVGLSPASTEADEGDECREEVWSWDHFRDSQVDGYWIRCSLLGPHLQHEDSHTGLTWPHDSSKE